MNHSSDSADRATHLKMLVVTLAVAIAIASFVIDLVKRRYLGRHRGG
jgi:uncharacterized membrane protein YwzB